MMTEAAGVVIVSAEDGMADTILPRINAAGGDPSKIVVLDNVPDGEGRERFLSLPEDIPHVKRAIARVGAKLAIFDPLMAFLSANLDAHRDHHVRRVLAELAALGEDTGAAVVVVRHLNKSSGTNPLYRGGGSIGIVGAARSALLVAKHPEDDQRRVLASQKSNLAEAPHSLAFALTEATNGAVRVEWKGETSLKANALLATPVSEEERREMMALSNAVTELLKENDGEWEGQPQKLLDTLEETTSAILPERPDELIKRLLKLAETEGTFVVRRKRKRAREGGEKVVRWVKLTLREPSQP
jgi:RecA-family ATPase